MNSHNDQLLEVKLHYARICKLRESYAMKHTRTHKVAIHAYLSLYIYIYNSIYEHASERVSVNEVVSYC